jgi:hypothetical protein
MGHQKNNGTSLFIIQYNNMPLIFSFDPF